MLCAGRVHPFQAGKLHGAAPDCELREQRFGKPDRQCRASAPPDDQPQPGTSFCRHGRRQHFRDADDYRAKHRRRSRAAWQRNRVFGLQNHERQLWEHAGGGRRLHGQPRFRPVRNRPQLRAVYAAGLEHPRRPSDGRVERQRPAPACSYPVSRLTVIRKAAAGNFRDAVHDHHQYRRQSRAVRNSDCERR